MSKSPLIDAVIARRKAKGITQEQAANYAGVGLKTYQRIEKGESDIRLRNYEMLLKKLGVTGLDMSLDALGFSAITAWDVAAAARLLPLEARSALVSMIMIIYRDDIDDH